MEIDNAARNNAISQLVAANTGDSLNGTNTQQQLDYSIALCDSEFIINPEAVLKGGTTS